MKQKHFIALLLLVLLLQVAIHAWIGNKWYFNDEHTYLSEGWLLTKGKIPFIDYHEIRPPLMELGVGAFFSIFGSSMETGRALALLAQLGTIVIVAFTARRLMDGYAALLAALLYSLMTPAFIGFQLLADPFLALFGMLAAALSFKALSLKDKSCNAWWLAPGLVVGLAVATRQSGVWQAAAILCVALLACAKGKKIQSAGLAFAGSLIPLSLLGAYYWLIGGLSQFLYGVFLGPAKLASDFMEVRYLFSTNETYLFFFIPLVAYFYYLNKEKSAEKRSILLILGLTGAAGVMAFFPNRSFFHLAPALPQLAIVMSLLIHRGPMAMLRKPIPALLYLIAIAGMLFFSALSWQCASSDGAVSGSYFYAEFDSQRFYETWRNIKENSSDGDVILGVPHVQPYFVAERMPASYYMSSGFWYGAEEMKQVRAAILSDLDGNKPLFIVYMVRHGYSLRSYAPEADAYVWENYAETERFEAKGVFNMSILRRVKPA